MTQRGFGAFPLKNQFCSRHVSEYLIPANSQVSLSQTHFHAFLSKTETRKIEDARLEQESAENMSEAENEAENDTKDQKMSTTPDNSNYGSEIGDSEEEEQQSQQYQVILGYLDIAEKNFFKLEASEKLQVVTLLIGEHLSSDELKDFQINFESHLKSNRRELKEDKLKLVELNKELVEMNNEGKPKENTGETVEGESTETAAEKPTEKPEKDVGSYRSRRIESSQKSKIREKKSRDIEMCTTNIENLEDTIKEMETAIDYIYRIVSIGTDRHRQQHYVFPGLPIIIEKPVNISKQGQILHSQWFYINDEDEYFSVAKTGLSKFGICESRLKKEILNIMSEQIKDNFEMYREALVGDDVGDENEENDENDENEATNENEENAENVDEMSDDENADSQNDLKNNQTIVKTNRSRTQSGISTNSSSPPPPPSLESEILTRIGSILEKSTKSNQIALGNCLSVPEKDLDSNTALEQLQIEMISPDFQLKNLIINILKNTYMKCLTFPLVDAEIREKWETDVAALKTESAKCDFSFLIFVLEASINSVNRRGRRANSNDLTLEEHLVQVIEERDAEVDAEEIDVEEEVEEAESEGEIIYSRSGRRQKQIKRYSAFKELCTTSRNLVIFKLFNIS